MFFISLCDFINYKAVCYCQIHYLFCCKKPNLKTIDIINIVFFINSYCLFIKIVIFTSNRKEFKKGSYDLALLDYKMPNMNGFELYTEIRKVDKKVKVCFITAFEIYYEELRKKFQSFYESSAYDKEDIKLFIQKPIEIDELVRQIKEELAS